MSGLVTTIMFPPWSVRYLSWLEFSTSYHWKYQIHLPDFTKALAVRISVCLHVHAQGHLTHIPLSPQDCCIHINMAFSYIIASSQPTIRLSSIYEIIITKLRGVKLKYMKGSAFEKFIPIPFITIKSFPQDTIARLLQSIHGT